MYPFTATCTQKPCRHMQQIAVYLFTAPSHTQQTAAYLFSHLYRDSCVPVNCPCRQLCTCLLPPCRQLCTCLLPPCTHTQQTAVYMFTVHMFTALLQTHNRQLFICLLPPCRHTQQTAVTVHMFTAPMHTHTHNRQLFTCFLQTHTIGNCLHVDPSCRHT